MRVILEVQSMCDQALQQIKHPNVSRTPKLSDQ